jgi:hypothetical protein
VDKADLDFLSLIRKATCAHSWLQSAVRQALKSGDARQEVLRWSSEHAEACIASLAHHLKESDPFLLQPDGVPFGPFDPDDPEGWLALGLSALILELILGKAGKLGKEQFAQFHWPLQAMGAGFGNERKFALAEAGRRSGGKRDARVKDAVAAFIPPCEAAWGAVIIEEAVAALEGRFQSRRALLHDAVAALREAKGLPHDAWPYIEPHLARHAKTFGIGLKERLIVRGYLKIT